MLQRSTAFDAVFPTLGLIQRTVIALLLAPLLGFAAAVLALKADEKSPA